MCSSSGPGEQVLHQLLELGKVGACHSIVMDFPVLGYPMKTSIRLKCSLSEGVDLESLVIGTFVVP